MRVLRLVVSVFGVLGLAAGYAASQFAYFSGRAAEYAEAANQPVVRYASLGLLAIAVILALIPDREGEPS